MSTPHNPPAFPQSITGSAGDMFVSYEFQDGAGQTLRDHFAGKAMQGALANGSIHELAPDEIADEAFNIAEAMLRRRDIHIMSPTSRKHITVDEGQYRALKTLAGWLCAHDGAAPDYIRIAKQMAGIALNGGGGIDERA